MWYIHGPSRAPARNVRRFAQPEYTRTLDTTGQHLLVEYWNCNSEVLQDRDRLERIMRNAAVAAGATVVGVVFQNFAPQGVSGVVVVEESHLSIHTWPEHGYASVDFYTCGDCRPEAARELLATELMAGAVETMTVERGHRAGPGLRVREHSGGSAGERRSAAGIDTRGQIRPNAG